MKQKSILILTDSLAFPRTLPEEVKYSETYISLLKHKFPEIDFIHYGHGGSTLPNLYEYSSYYHETLDPFLVIIQCGIVDCAPRALTLTESQILKRIPLFNRPLLYLVKKYSKNLRKYRKISYTSLDEFKTYIEMFEKIFSKIIWIGIMPPPKSYIEKVPNIEINVNQFNKLIKQKDYINSDKYDETNLMKDGHHLTKKGHMALYQDLLSQICDLVS